MIEGACGIPDLGFEFVVSIIRIQGLIRTSIFGNLEREERRSNYMRTHLHPVAA